MDANAREKYAKRGALPTWKIPYGALFAWEGGGFARWGGASPYVIVRAK